MHHILNKFFSNYDLYVNMKYFEKAEYYSDLAVERLPRKDLPLNTLNTHAVIKMRLNKLNESWLYPIHFVGSVAYGFRDVLKQLAIGYEIELGKIVKSPMDGLIEYHRQH